jgi:hypothetical protein
MGVVYEAEQQHPKRSVAIKVVRGGQFVDEHRVNRRRPLMFSVHYLVAPSYFVRSAAS